MGKTSKQCYENLIKWWNYGEYKRPLTYSQWCRALKKYKFRDIHHKYAYGIPWAFAITKKYRRR